MGTFRGLLRARALKTETRRGNVIVLTVFMLLVALAILALAVDIGFMMVAKTEAQSCADASALAAAWELVGSARLKGNYDAAFENASTKATSFAAENGVAWLTPLLKANPDNLEDGDFVVGRLNQPADLSEAMSFGDSSTFNAVRITLRFDGSENENCPFLFARIIGHNHFTVTATATASFVDNIRGFKMIQNGHPCSLMPFGIKQVDWEALMDEITSGEFTQDEFGMDVDGNVVAGPDGIPEMQMYCEKLKGNAWLHRPDSDVYALIGGNGGGNSTGGSVGSGGSDSSGTDGAGNWGTVDIGEHNNSTPDIVRQILHGPSYDDLLIHGGLLALDKDTGTLDLNGDTGISDGIKSALEDVKGRPRTMLIFDQITTSGDNATLRITGFVGIRIMEVNLTGNNKYILIQPSFVTDNTSQAGTGAGYSRFVGQPVHLVR